MTYNYTIIVKFNTLKLILVSLNSYLLLFPKLTLIVDYYYYIFIVCFIINYYYYYYT